MHYYSVFKDQPFWGERKLYSLNPDRVNGYVRILRRNFHRPRRKAPPQSNLRILMVEVKPPRRENRRPPYALTPALISRGIHTIIRSCSAASFGRLLRS